VKILDFGLAKALEGKASEEDSQNSPTLSAVATHAGVLLGTAAYMSPEQARGKRVDRRADIWAFGCVLYEMLTGRGAFNGETTSDILAAVIRAEPDWRSLPGNIHPRVRDLLRRCLQKEIKQRLQAIGDARITIEEVLSGAGAESLQSVPHSRAKLREQTAWSVAAASLVAAVVLAVLVSWPAPNRAIPLKATLLPPQGYQFSPLSFAMSPDGSKIAFVATARSTRAASSGSAH
jgi:serine/threonine protein kinase